MNGGAQKLSSYAWAVVALLWPVAMLNYLDRQMVSSIRASIRADIPSIANDQDFGTLMAVFMWVYAFLSPVGGFIADNFLGARRSVLYGGIVIAVGHFVLAIPRAESFAAGLVLIVLGTGMLKPSISPRMTTSS